MTTVPSGRTFFGQMNDGTLVIGGVDTKGVTRPVDRALLKNAVGGAQWLIDNNVKVPTFGDVSIEPRTAIGYTANNVIYAVVVDGRQEAYSNGINFPDLRDIFVALGTKDAINLDGGGSSTLVTKDVAKNQWLVQNKPSQAFNAERLVGNGLAFVLKK